MSAMSFDRRQFLGAGAASIAGVALPSCATLRSEREFDLVLSGGRIVDGDGGAAFDADVGLRGDTIVAIGALDRRRASRVLDITGLCLAPGFVDIHTHSDRSIFEWPQADSRIRQGCTTEITGNCGGSAAPRDAARSDDEGGPTAEWTDVTSYAKAWDANDAALNQALLIGHGTLRSAVLGDVDRAATSEELAEMVRRLELALTQGAIGLSTGLEYVPGIYTPPAEIVELARVVARHGGLYASHIRSEEEHLLDAIGEVIDVARRTGVRTQISHLKACGRGNWSAQDPAIELIERARGEGLDVMADAYPYTAYSTGLSILLEPWSREGGAAAILARLRDPEQRARMLLEVAPHVARDPGGFELIVIASVEGAALQACVGKDMAEIARAWNVEPAEAFLRMLEGSAADVGYVGHGMSERNVERVLAQPFVMVGSDGRAMAPSGRALENRPHPRSYGTFPRVLAHYCRERGLFDLPTAVRKMTSMPADRAGLVGRGRIARGAKADLVAFDFERVRDGATFDAPQSFPDGIVHVFVNGVAVVANEATTGARPGRLLRAPHDVRG